MATRRMRYLNLQPLVRNALAALLFCAMLLAPLGHCCHDHGDGPHTVDTHGPAGAACVGYCLAHFSVTLQEPPAIAEPPAPPTGRYVALDEGEPLSGFVASIEHPPKA